MEHDILADVLSYIDIHIHEKITLGELAELATVRKYLTFYQVPEFVVPANKHWRENMDTNKRDTLQNNLHQLVFEVLQEALQEAREGFCTKIDIIMLDGGRIKISDNGRGIPLSQNKHADESVLAKILEGRPISKLEYSQMGDFQQLGLQTVNSLCENLQLTVYRDGVCFRQDYVRGIPQHEISAHFE